MVTTDNEPDEKIINNVSHLLAVSIKQIHLCYVMIFEKRWIFILKNFIA